MQKSRIFPVKKRKAKELPIIKKFEEFINNINREQNYFSNSNNLVKEKSSNNSKIYLNSLSKFSKLGNIKHN